MTKVLIVLDGGYRFEQPALEDPDAAQDFTYTVLVGALEGAKMEVKKAHREADGSADFESFNFATSVDLLDYDVIWLFGHRGRNQPGSAGESGEKELGEAELAAITRFMAAGGGVFATGDHDSIGADMCGHIPRVRAMRAWYGEGDPVSDMPDNFPRNFPSVTPDRADTTQKNPLGDYDFDGDGSDEAFVWFENQSDSIPQPITPATVPTHPILRRNGADIAVYPDHMHEGKALGKVDGYDYAQLVPLDGASFPEFPAVAGNREVPIVIARGRSLPNASRVTDTGVFVGDDASLAGEKDVNVLSVYDGRVAGVGRIVTGSTFHHYIDINLTGDSYIVTPLHKARAGPDAEKGQGFNYVGAEATFADIKAVFVNITNWLARPRPALNVIIERSTFSQAEAAANPDFNGAILVTVDGLKPTQFPDKGIITLSPSPEQLESWAPTVTPVDSAGLLIEPIGVASDDPTLADRLQRLTFTYRVRFVDKDAAFGFMEAFRNIQIDAALSSDALADPLGSASAWIGLVNSANPFMLDLAGGNMTAWLSSDVRVFPVVEDSDAFGVTLPADADRPQALEFIRQLVATMSVADFESLSVDQAASALSPFALTTESKKKVYNFAVARVRLNPASATANEVRVFFRMFTSQTTAALAYNERAGIPIEGYMKTQGAAPIAIPGVNDAGTEWLSFPFFSGAREASPEMQTDPDNVKTISEESTFFGALIDSNLGGAYLPLTPLSVDGPVDLPMLLMGEHQCLVAQIEHAGTSIPSGALPSTSDKLAQRNIALSAIANPGLDASRTALHTFEIEATPRPITDRLPPDELLLDWARDVPDGTYVRLFIPSWNAQEVVELADRFYPRHELRAVDAHTVSVPGGGVRYVPIPRAQQRQTGVIMADFPLGVRKGERFDLAVRQVTSRSRRVDVEPPRTTIVSREEAAKLIQGLDGDTAAPLAVFRRGVFDLGENRTLITDLSVLDAVGDHAVIIEFSDPQTVAAANRRAGSWRETIGAFQLGIPVSAKADMLAHHLRLLSVLRWRAELLRPDNRWYASFVRYVELMSDKVRALGGDPFAVPATPDGAIPLPGQDGGHAGDENWPMVWWLILLILLVIAFVLGALAVWLFA